jgi:peptidoglycan/xylan/chitin deacetylase (PgdA/CDA1 family)
MQTGKVSATELMTHTRRVTLTFDNGPTPGVTERVLDLLSARNIHSTFFVLGKNLEAPGGRELAEMAHSQGHWIGNHSYTHTVPLGNQPNSDYARREIAGTQERIGDLAHTEKFFRPMGGGGIIGPHLLSRAALQLLQADKYTCVLWSSVPGDWKDQNGWVEKAVADITVREWTVVVLHDVDNACLPRLPEFLDRLDSLQVEVRQDFPPDVMVTIRGEIVSPEISQIVA